MRHDVSCEFEGKTYSAQYFVDADTLTVTSVNYGSKSASAGSSPETLANLLLRELLLDSQRRVRL